MPGRPLFGVVGGTIHGRRKPHFSPWVSQLPYILNAHTAGRVPRCYITKCDSVLVAHSQGYGNAAYQLGEGARLTPFPLQEARGEGFWEGFLEGNPNRVSMEHAWETNQVACVRGTACEAERTMLERPRGET